jgi:hypothetical protein
VFEVKLKGPRDRTVKAQLPYSLADRTHITPLARAFLVDRLEKAYGQSAPRLAARVTTLYRRTTLVDLDRGTRLTCDVDLAYIGNGRRAVGPSQYVLVESKGVAPHRDADATLRRLGLRPIQMSKYCVAVALLFPGRPLRSLASDAPPLLRRSLHRA